MAKAVRGPEKLLRKDTRDVILTLSFDEAEALRKVIQHIGGPVESTRGVFARLDDVLDTVGVEVVSCGYDEGSIYFTLISLPASASRFNAASILAT